MSQSSERILAECRRTGFGVMTAAFVVSAGINLLMLTSPLYMLQVYDRVIASRHVDTLVLLTVMAAGGLAAYAVLESVRSVVGLRLAAWIDRRLAGLVVSATVGQGQVTGGTRGVPALRDLSTVRSLFSGGGIWPLLDAPWSAGFYLILFLVHPLLGWCGVAGGLVLLVIAALNELVSRKPIKEAGQKTILAVGTADAAVRNADAMLAMGMLPSFIARWGELNDRALDRHEAAAYRSAVLSALAKAVRIALQVASLAVGAWLVTRSELSGGAMVASSIIAARAVAPLEQSIGAWRSIVSAQTAWQRLKELLRGNHASPERMRLPRPDGRIAVERALYAVRFGAEPILRQASFTLDAGESLAILGPSGAGKSTLLRLLVGSLKPSAGAVRLDGGAVADWADADKARFIGYLPQDVELFQATVRDNIARFSDASDEDVVAAATLAGAHEMILRLPEGYATPIGPGGVMLSGGQRQRIGLARALFGDPRLVVLDEPNAHLDADGERALQDALRALKARSTTVILVAQRLSVVSMVDKIMKLRDGRVDMMGPRDEVLGQAAGAEKGKVLRVPPLRTDHGRLDDGKPRVAAGGV